MRVFCMPQAFKGSLGAMAAAEAMAQGVLEVMPDAEVQPLPMADGGDDTLDVLVRSTGGQFFTTEVWDALGRRVKAQWGVMGDGETAVIEMAQASGIRLLKRYERDPRTATTVGTGQLIRHALDQGYRKMIVGVGGSATVDGGAGAVKALGGHFRDASGLELHPGGAALANLAAIDLRLLDKRLRECEIRVACDVIMPLCGPGGAWKFAAQKGATPDVSLELEKALEHYAQVVARVTGTDLREMDMAGAAGGLAGGLHVFLGAKLVPGAELVLEAAGLAERIPEADLILIGEGALDANSFRGKGTGAVAARAKAAVIPVIAIVGQVVAEEIPPLPEVGIRDVESLLRHALTEDVASKRAAELITTATIEALRRYLQTAGAPPAAEPATPPPMETESPAKE